MSCSWLVSVGSQSDLGWLAHSLVGSGFCFDLSLFEIASPKNDSFIVSSDFCDYSERVISLNYSTRNWQISLQ